LGWTLGDHHVAKTKIVIITDAWHPQVNGVVTTYSRIIQHRPQDVEITVVEPGQFPSRPAPGYKDIQLAWCSPSRMKKILIDQGPARYHIATEGPLGLVARQTLRGLGLQYTTAYHSEFPKFFHAMWGLPTWASQWYWDWFHSDSKLVFCSSHSSAKMHPRWKTVVLDRGYDPQYQPLSRPSNNPRILTYVGRVSVEKNLDAFCQLTIPNSRMVIVGDGPYRSELEKKYPHVEFVGYQFGSQLAHYYQQSDVFVFPSKSDTFGIVILEAMASGTPCAAYPVTGPIDQIVNGVNGYMSDDLAYSIEHCYKIDRQSVYNSVKHKTWDRVSEKFVQLITDQIDS